MEKIIFLITNKFGDVPNNTINTIILTWDDWNDYSYYTMFGVEFIDSTGRIVNLGAVRIAYFGQQIGSQAKTLKIGDSFDTLGSKYFSLGTDDTYYENINNLGEELRNSILNGLNDIAINMDIYENAINEEVTINSLLRDISTSTVINQYRRIANGGARLTNYSFSYYFPQNKVKTTPLKIDFEVIANHNPPTNIQIIIGRNGVGKSHLLNDMVDCILNSQTDDVLGKRFILNEPDRSESFSNLVCVMFSAFDEFQFHEKQRSSDIKYHYIGLKNLKAIQASSEKRLGNDINLGDEFTSSIGLIVSASKVNRWKSVVKILESDPVFESEKIIELIDNYESEKLSPIKERFAKLSSGHKIILLTITKLVELIQEKSLVFFDEPEMHLHPPLLSSFIRALSELFTNRNAVCIMTTHSPIVLQEVPNSCVLKLSRIGAVAKFERLDMETFGENIGVLTNDIFGLEVTDSGFYNILKELVSKHNNYDEAFESINQELGIEGRAILRSLFFDKEKGNETHR